MINFYKTKCNKKRNFKIIEKKKKLRNYRESYQLASL